MLRPLRDCFVPLPAHLGDMPSGQVASSGRGVEGGADGGGGLGRVAGGREPSPPKLTGDKVGARKRLTIDVSCVLILKS